MSKENYILFVAPFPDPSIVIEGWMSRIAAVDHIFAEKSRVYVHFWDGHKEETSKVVCENPFIKVYYLNSKNEAHKKIFEKLLKACRFCYCHTVHLAEHISEWLPTGKIIVDIHGIVPEEELMLGSPERAEYFSTIETLVLRHAKYLVVVTSAMQHHLLQKYPNSRANFIVLPIFERYNKNVVEYDDRHFDVKPAIIYSGATQVWQNVDLMLHFAQKMNEHIYFHFLSNDFHSIKKKAKQLGISKNVSFGIAKKHEIPGIYKKFPFGMVFRDDVPVNRVSCPTKLSEYLDFGIIPIVKSPLLGDFLEDGYSYVTIDEFSSGFIPDYESRAAMRRRNYYAINRLRQRFNDSSKTLLTLQSL